MSKSVKKFLDANGLAHFAEKLDQYPTVDDLNIVIHSIDQVKEDKVAGKGLSTNDYTNSDKAKLDAISDSADAVSFSRSLNSGTKIGTLTINGNGTDLFAPTNTNTTYTLTQDATDGHKFTLTGSDGSSKTITIPDNNTTYTLASLGIGNVKNYDQSKAIKSISRSGTTFTYTCLDNTTGTFTQQDNNTWTAMAGATSSANGTAGYVPAPPKDGYNTKYLRADGSWTVPPNTTYSSKAAASGGTDVSLVTTGEKYTWNSKTSNTGTVSSVATGAGLTGGTITGSGTIKAKLKSETASTLDSTAMGSTASRQYAVGVDKSGYLSVNIPWTNTTYSAATTSANGLMSSTDKAKLDSVSLPVILANQSIATFTSAAAGRPLRVTAYINAVQAGSGNPSPSNVRSISGWTAVNITVSPNTQGTNGTTYTVTFSSSIGTVYGGTLDVTRGLLTVTHFLASATKEEIKASNLRDGAVQWYEVRKDNVWARIIWRSADDARSTQLCDIARIANPYTSTEVTTYGTQIAMMGPAGGTSNAPVIPSMRVSVALANSMANNSTLHLVYKMAYPITYWLVPQQLVTLAGSNNVLANCGSVNVTHWPGSGIPVTPVEDSSEIAYRAQTLRQIEELRNAILAMGGNL